MNSGNVYIFKDTNDFTCIGKINVESVTINPIQLDSVNNFNQKILEYISQDDNIKDEVYDFIETNEIIGLVIKILRWRRCTGFIVLQKSNAGTRVICYLYDKIKHGAQSFGTDYIHVELNYVKAEIEKAFIKFSKDIVTFENILKFKNFKINNTKFGL